MKKVLLLCGILMLASCSADQTTAEDATEVVTSPEQDTRIGQPLLMAIPYDCGVDYDLDDITGDVLWNIGDNSSKYIDYQLEEIFQSNWRFNLRMIKRGEPTLVGYGEIEYVDTPTIDIITGNPVYAYLSDPTTAVNANLIKQDLACKMKEYVALNYPGYFIYDVDVFGDALLCGGSCVSRYERVRFKIGY